MAKRFTDSRKWDDPFWIELSNDYKTLWIYLLDKCSHAGIYKHSDKLMNFYVPNVSWSEALKIFSDRIIYLKKDKYFIPKFISFQYGVLQEKSSVHRSVYDELLKEGVDVNNYTLSEGLPKGCITPKDKAKAKAKDKDKDKNNKKATIDFINSLKTNPAYVGIDIDKELAKMDAWLLTPKGRGRKKNHRFILNWLNRIDTEVKHDSRVAELQRKYCKP